MREDVEGMRKWRKGTDVEQARFRFVTAGAQLRQCVEDRAGSRTGALAQLVFQKQQRDSRNLQGGRPLSLCNYHRCRGGGRDQQQLDHLPDLHGIQGPPFWLPEQPSRHGARDPLLSWRLSRRYSRWSAVSHAISMACAPANNALGRERQLRYS